jgi:metabolite-proton symporter
MSASSEAQLSRSAVTRIVIACFIGSTVEWFDFFAYAAASALVFPTLFFPGLSPVAATLAAFATFGVGFVGRPLGGVLMGHFGDRVGRKSMLIISLVGMGVATFGVGLLPTYGHIGVFAPILLVTLRFLQGMAVGGEWGGAVLVAVEHAPEKKRGLYGSFVQMGIPAGVILSNIVFLVVSEALSPESFLAWGWRVPFLLSAVLVGIGLTIRLSLTETPQFRKALAAQKLSRTPVAEVLRTSWRQVILAAGTFVAPNAMGYIVITYSLSYTTRILQLNRNTVIWAILAASAVWLVVAGWVAAMSDRWGRRRVLVLCLSALTMWSLVFFALLDTGSFPLVLLALVVLAALQGAANGPQAALFAELFETHVRYSGISLAYQVGSILGGGVAPFLATALYDIRLSTLPVTGYLVLISIVSLGCAFAIRESGPHHQQMSSRTASRPGLHTHE